MKQTVSKSDFCNNQTMRKEFSYEALGHLYELLEEVNGEDYEFDPVALCCEFTEDDIGNVLKSYNLQTFEELQDSTLIVYANGTNVLYQAF